MPYPSRSRCRWCLSRLSKIYSTSGNFHNETNSSKPYPQAGKTLLLEGTFSSRGGSMLTLDGMSRNNPNAPKTLSGRVLSPDQNTHRFLSRASMETVLGLKGPLFVRGIEYLLQISTRSGPLRIARPTQDVYGGRFRGNARCFHQLDTIAIIGMIEKIQRFQNVSLNLFRKRSLLVHAQTTRPS